MASTGLLARPAPDRLVERSCASRFANSAGTSASPLVCRLDPTSRLGIGYSAKDHSHSRAAAVPQFAAVARLFDEKGGELWYYRAGAFHRFITGD
jgi:hypothetical protein